jgi:hypothetical protein
MNGYKFKRKPCPKCGKILAENWYVRHMKAVHSWDSQEVDEDAIRESVERRGYYGYWELAWEQREGS